MTTGNDRVEETVWEYKALILDRDNKPQGPNTWVSKPTSLIKVKEGDPDAQYEACEFGNRSSHHVAFRITKANGLQFNPDHGVLKPNERVPLKFKVRPSTRPPEQSEVEILAMRVNPTSSGKMIEDKWRLMPTNKVSRVGHTVQLRAPEKTRQRPLLTPPPTPCVTPPRPENTTGGRPQGRRGSAGGARGRLAGALEIAGPAAVEEGLCRPGRPSSLPGQGG
ncbi:hypothetical protein MTO96_011778 [Rhipicephalus appendiculatus]